MGIALIILLLFPLIVHGASESTVVPLDKLVPTVHKQTWDELIAPQLAERDRQNEEKKLAAQQAQQVAQKAAQAAQVVAAKPIVTYPVSTDTAKAFIYKMESGNNPGAINRSSGACGLGQALPCSKLPCTLTDYACQDAWFTNYALGRYGSWASAYAFWLLHHWW